MSVNNIPVILANQTASLTVTSASYAYTASSAINASASLISVSASYSYTASSAISSSFANSASVAYSGTGSFTGSFIGVHTGSLFGTASQATSASYAYTASSAINSSASLIATSASYAYTASSAIVASASLIAISASYAYTASSAIVASASLIAVSASYAYTASSAISSSYTQLAATASNIQGGISNYIAVWSGSTQLSASSIYQTSSTVVINQTGYTTSAPEALYVWQPSTSSYNVISGKGNLNNYLQLNIQNTNNGNIVSSDIVATANNGNENNYYVDLGINGQNYNGNISAGPGSSNDGYLYNVGNDFYIGNYTTGKSTYFFNGQGGDHSPILSLAPDNNVYISSSLGVTESILAYGGVTGSLFGTASIAISSSYAISASYAISSSYSYTASSAINASASLIATSASYTYTASSAIQSYSASYAYTASSAIVASASLIAVSASYAYTASSAIQSYSASYAQTSSFANNFTVANTLTAQTLIVSTISSSVEYSSGSNVFGNSLSNTQTMTGSVNITGSLNLNNNPVIASNQTGSMSVLSSSYALTASYLLGYVSPFPFTGSAIITGSLRVIGQGVVSGSYIITGSFTVTGSTNQYGNNALLGNNSITGSNNILGTTIMSGSINVSGSQYFTGAQIMSGSIAMSGSITQAGNNTLIGNTVLSGSLIISGSQATTVPNIQIFGDTDINGILQFNPVTANTLINTSVSASYIYVSGSTQDLYFSQNGAGYANTTRLRWIEDNLYTGLFNGGVITSQSSTVYQVGSGSGIIVNLNANIASNPYPTIQYFNWPDLSASIAPLSASYDQSFVSIQYASGAASIHVQGTPYVAGQFDTLISIGVVTHNNHSTISAVKTQPSVAYGWKQRSSVFTRAFGPLKLSGFSLSPSGSSTGSLVIGSGTAYQDGANYTVDPNNPAYVSADQGTNVSKIWRYYQSGSGTNNWVYDTNNSAGYLSIDPAHYSNNGVLTTVPTGGGGNWTIQRVYWFPNSVTKAIIVYYGNAYYSDQATATAAINVENFTEAPNTAANAIYLGSLIVKNNANFTNSATYAIVPGGLFRSIGGISGGSGNVTAATLAGLSDVNITEGSGIDQYALMWNNATSKWIASNSLGVSITGNAQTATSASYATSASFALIALSGTGSFSGSFSGSLIGTSSYALTAVSSSYALTASYLAGYVSPFPYSGSAQITGSLGVTGSISTTGTITAQTLVVQTVTSSVVFSSGSNRFGNDISNTQVFTGSVLVTGSITVANNVTNNLTASWANRAISASIADNAVTASYVLNAVSASFATNAATATTASYIQNAASASYALSASYATASAFATSASIAQNAVTASYVLSAVSASYAISASYATASAFANNATSASYALTATSASYANNATTASYALTATSASYSLTSTSASYAPSSTSASYAATASFILNGVSASYAQTASYANATAVSGFGIGGSAIYYSTVNVSIAGSNNLFTLSTGSYTAATIQYTVFNGSNSRAGQIIASWNNGNVQYTDFSTVDNSSTAQVTMSIAIISSQMQFNAQTNTSGWTIKSQATLI